MVREQNKPLHPDIVVQPPLPLIGEQNNISSIAYLRSEIGIGDTAQDVLDEVLRFNPGVTRLSYTTYDATRNSEYEGSQEQGLFWIARSLATDDNIRLLKRIIEDESEKIILISTTEALIFERTLAVASRVKVGEKDFHILQLDFDEELDVVGREVVDEIAMELSLPPGYILGSGKSFHYWGVQLMAQEDWEDYLKWLTVKEKERYLDSIYCLDLGFLETSLKRGFSALRILPHGDVKPDTPVVDFIWRG